DLPRVGVARRVVRPVGRVILLHRGRGQGAAVPHHRSPAGRAGRAYPARSPARAWDEAAEGPPHLGRPGRHGVPQQCRAVLVHRLGPDPHCVRSRLDTERDHASGDGSRGACADPRRENDPEPARRRDGGFRRRGPDDRPRRVGGPRDERLGPVGLPLSRRVLPVRRRVRPPLQADGRGPDCDRRGPGHRFGPHAAPRRSSDRPAMDASPAQPHCMGRGARPGRALDRAGLCALFPDSRQRGRDEPYARDVSHPGHRNPARKHRARRAARPGAFPRHGLDRRRPRGDRRPPAQADDPRPLVAALPHARKQVSRARNLSGPGYL
ncbi:MAG: Permease of the drug/metabolite transporter (DMT) superfamily, partial [uncultured Microvirga sp.]